MKMPAFNMSFIETFPVEYAMAFGGVPTGKRKSRLTAIPPSIARVLGEKFSIAAKGNKMGIKIAAVAVFEAKAPRAIENTTMPRITKIKGYPWIKEAMPLAKKSERPEENIALPKTRPPPNKIRT